MWESVCVFVYEHVAYVYTGMCALSRNRVIQHVSSVLTGGSVSSSSGGIKAHDDVCGHVLSAAWFMYEVCVKAITTLACR